jgi:hypothetical protein
MNKILAGMQIIAKYDEDFCTDAQHDQIWAGPGVDMNEEDTQAMLSLGWFWDEESWSHFTG